MGATEALKSGGGRGRSSRPILSSIVQYYRPRIEFRPVLGRGRDGAQFSGGKYYRPWTDISSALDGNIIGLDEDGTEPNSQKGNIIGLGRKYYRPWTEISSAWTRPGRSPNLRQEILSALGGNIIGLGRGRDGSVLALDGILTYIILEQIFCINCFDITPSVKIPMCRSVLCTG